MFEGSFQADGTPVANFQNVQVLGLFVLGKKTSPLMASIQDALKKR